MGHPGEVDDTRYAVAEGVEIPGDEPASELETTDLGNADDRPEEWWSKRWIRRQVAELRRRRKSGTNHEGRNR